MLVTEHLLQRQAYNSDRSPCFHTFPA